MRAPEILRTFRIFATTIPPARLKYSEYSFGLTLGPNRQRRLPSAARHGCAPTAAE
jgi:hypothetical protein